MKELNLVNALRFGGLDTYTIRTIIEFCISKEIELDEDLALEITYLYDLGEDIDGIKEGVIEFMNPLK